MSQFTACLEQHSVKVPDQSAQPPQRRSAFAGWSTSIRRRAWGQGSETFRRALEACRRYAPQNGQMAPQNGQTAPPASALANRPDVLLANEPTGNLDTATGEKIMTLLRALSAESGHTLILITHDTEIATRSPRVIRMQDGRLLTGSALEEPEREGRA
jgi:ABC-type sugar transport system ATPase subunit